MADHFSGPRAVAEPTADITDLYVFPSPERPGHLVLVMNVFPFADSFSRFSDAIIYRFRLRPVAIAATGSASAFSVDADEFVIDVIFSPLVDQGAGRLAQEGTCAMPSGEAIPFAVSDEHGGHADGVRVFAGPRSDPFFLDMLALRNSRKLRQLAFTDPGTNTIDGLNVLSIAVEANAAQFGGGPLLGVVAETLAAGKLPVRMERFGRPELKNIIMAPKIYDEINRDLEIRDLYNSEDAFDLGPAYLGTYRARLNANLAFYDSLDGTIDRPLGEDGAHPLTEFLLPDFMVVDVTKPFSDEGCFEIERAMLADRPHATCGGRSLNDDAMDSLFTLIIGNGETPVRDGADQATVPASRTFPYLAPPNPIPPELQSRPERIAAFVAEIAAGEA